MTEKSKHIPLHYFHIFQTQQRFLQRDGSHTMAAANGGGQNQYLQFFVIAILAIHIATQPAQLYRTVLQSLLLFLHLMI